MKIIKQLTRGVGIALSLMMVEQAFAQSPILSIPSNYRDVIGGTTQTLPQPDPTNWNSSTWHTPIYGLDDEAYDGRPALGGHNAMYDINGDLLFFIVDNVIYDKDGWVMDVMGDPTGSNGYCLMGESQYLIVPHADDCNKYFIVGTTFEADLYDVDIQNSFIPRNSRYVLLDLAAYNTDTQRMGIVANPIDGISYGNDNDMASLYPPRGGYSEYPDGAGYNPHYQSAI